MATSERGGRPRIAVLVSYSGDGGVERMMNILIAGFMEHGHEVDVLVLGRRGGHFAAIPVGARIVPLWPGHAALAAPALVRYLKRERPAVVLAAKDRAGRLALRARARAGVDTRVIVRIGNNLSQSLVGRGRLRRWLRYRPIRRWYPRADRIVAISHGVADDVVATSGVDRSRVGVVYNPVVAPELERLAQEAPQHPWLGEAGPPVILGVGRLTRQKDFPTLLRAFARVRASRDARLIILGEGEDRAMLERLARDLGIDAALELPGFVDNPWAWMRCADLFVLSSRWEGFGNVLVEAMAAGTPVVSTDCPSGPAEILDAGRWGSLVPVGDPEALASAMLAALAEPLPPERLREAAARFDREHSTRGYLELIGATITAD